MKCACVRSFRPSPGPAQGAGRCRARAQPQVMPVAGRVPLKWTVSHFIYNRYIRVKIRWVWQSGISFFKVDAHRVMTLSLTMTEQNYVRFTDCVDYKSRTSQNLCGSPCKASTTTTTGRGGREHRVTEVGVHGSYHPQGLGGGSSWQLLWKDTMLHWLLFYAL